MGFLQQVGPTGVEGFISRNWPVMLGYIGLMLYYSYQTGRLKKTIEDLITTQNQFHNDLAKHSEDDFKAHEQMRGLQGQIDTQRERHAEDRDLLKETVRLLDIHIKQSEIHVNPKYDYSRHEELMRRLGEMESGIKSLSIEVVRLDKNVAIVLSRHNMKHD